MKTKKYIDFHMHTRFSDGELTPQNLVSCMASRGMDIIALSDHDNYRAYFEGKNTADKYGIKLIPAAEITTPDYHLLSLGFDPEDKEIQEFLDRASFTQEAGVVRKVKILQEYGVPISMEKLKAEFPFGRLGKGNIKSTMYADKDCRNYLAKHHPTFSPNDVFRFYLGKEGIAKETWDKEAVSCKEAIDAVHKAGGIIGIAHSPKDCTEVSELETLVKLGMDFLEIQPNARPLKAKGNVTYEVVEEFANKNNLPLSYGSDYHGPNYDRPFLNRGENFLSDKMAKLLSKCRGIKNPLE